MANYIINPPEVYTAFLTAFLISELHDNCILLNQSESEYFLNIQIHSSQELHNHLTMSLIGLKMDTSFVLTNRPVVLRGLM